MLETIREYAAERLEESGEGETIRRAHAAYYLALGERARPYLTGPEGAVWQGRLGWEHDNLRETMHWAVRQGEEELALRLVGVLGPFWEARGYFREPGR